MKRAHGVLAAAAVVIVGIAVTAISQGPLERAAAANKQRNIEAAFAQNKGTFSCNWNTRKELGLDRLPQAFHLSQVAEIPKRNSLKQATLRGDCWLAANTGRFI